MSVVVIGEARVAAAHDGDAELIIELHYENGSHSEMCLDIHASKALMDICQVDTVEALVGQSWERVKEALQSAYNRYQN